jgi:hypothetical protein
VFVDCDYRVPSMTDFILERKATSLPSRKSSPWDSSIPRVAWKSSWYSELTLKRAPKSYGDSFDRT